MVNESPRFAGFTYSEWTQALAPDGGLAAATSFVDALFAAVPTSNGYSLTSHDVALLAGLGDSAQLRVARILAASSPAFRADVERERGSLAKRKGQDMSDREHSSLTERQTQNYQSSQGQHPLR